MNKDVISDQAPEQSALERAIEYLGAVEVAPAKACEHIAPCADPQDCGMVNRFAYQHEGAWFVASRAAVCSLAGIRHDEPEGGWNAVSAKQMPFWWSPEKQFAVFDRFHSPAKFLGSYKSVSTAKMDYYCSIGRVGEGPYIYTVTADLETGEEVTL